MVVHLSAMTIALILDRFIGDPPNWPHPVRWIGSLIMLLERNLNKGNHRKLKGIIHLIIVLLVVSVIGWGMVEGAYKISWIAGFLFEIALITSALAAKSLKVAALDVLLPLEEADLETARTKLSWIVGRDTDQLNESEIVRGTIETVAENTSDGITAPLFWALIGGAPAIWLYKAINTGDSIVGYRNECYVQYGWASAKFDDFANWIPSRMTAFCMIWAIRPVHGVKRRFIFKHLPLEAKKHPSPNSGWGEAAVALLLDIKLGGRNTYQGIISNRPIIGSGKHRLASRHIHHSIRIMDHAVYWFLLLCWITGGSFYVLALTWR
ncbi:adenosylcobinamide-phosphate synthase CbiB [Jeotgalibacillus soli]|uniref:Cobalamin biosynthesis protein CobD n=1 Tax=Jeotgalibacillus soli TaxID=889306 RepID=A0A0C2RHR0_9BACL|nr:adenosylcobinamide-phosphate synthase CbiB [Jeotgalibacillus soli]KIL49715.1 hypothetical protein KP78_11830 [Jeotgalibacillus soli]